MTPSPFRWAELIGKAAHIADDPSRHTPKEIQDALISLLEMIEAIRRDRRRPDDDEPRDPTTMAEVHMRAWEQKRELDRP